MKFREKGQCGLKKRTGRWLRKDTYTSKVKEYTYHSYIHHPSIKNINRVRFLFPQSPEQIGWLRLLDFLLSRQPVWIQIIRLPFCSGEVVGSYEPRCFVARPFMGLLLGWHNPLVYCESLNKVERTPCLLSLFNASINLSLWILCLIRSPSPARADWVQHWFRKIFVPSISKPN